MEIISKAGKDDIATVYLGRTSQGKLVEFVESVQPPVPREKKWVLIISTLSGCPVKCLMCDASGNYSGRLSREDMAEQIDYMVNKRFPGAVIPVEKFKIQFARMGEPSFNPAVLDLITELKERYNSQNIIPSISTVAPKGTELFFDKLLEIKKENYKGGSFQLQFSLHTTDINERDRLIPVKKWSFSEISSYCERFYEEGDRKITLNFAAEKNLPIDGGVLKDYFSPEKFLIKLTPLNPTYSVIKNKLDSYISCERQENHKDINLIKHLERYGYEVILSQGELEENLIGSNCGQYLTKHISENAEISGGYSYEIMKPTNTSINSSKNDL